jgi:hypothetical protein
MSEEALFDDSQGPLAPEPDARSRISPPVHGIAPAWEPIEHAPAIQPAPIERHVIDAARGLSLEPDEHRSAMSGTAERIGSAVGSAQRQMRRGLELVSSKAAHLSHEERQRLQNAASTLHDIGGEVDGIRHHLGQWSAEAGERLVQIRSEISSAPSRWRARGQQFAAQYPLQTIAAIAGVSFAAGVALRLSRRSHRG